MLPSGVPASWQQRLEITSLTFMLNWVPLPVIQTCSGNMSWCWPARISSQSLDDQSVWASRPSRPACVVRDRGRLLDDRVGGDHLARHQVVADAEMLQRALRLRPPQLVGGNLDRAEAVGFPANFDHRTGPPIPIQRGANDARPENVKSDRSTFQTMLLTPHARVCIFKARSRHPSLHDERSVQSFPASVRQGPTLSRNLPTIVVQYGNFRTAFPVSFYGKNKPEAAGGVWPFFAASMLFGGARPRYARAR